MRSALQLAGIALVVAGVPVFLFIAYAMATWPKTGTGIEVAVSWALALGITALSGGPLALGAWLVGRGAPGAWASLGHGLVDVLALRDLRGTAQSRPWTTRLARGAAWLVSTPVGTCVLLPFCTVLPLMWPGEAGSAVAMLALVIFSVANPLLCLVRPPWLVGTSVSCVAFGVSFVAMGATPGMAAMREGAMVFIAPLVGYPACATLSGIVRALVLWKRRAHGGVRS
jgi:hypothetical protein